VFKCEFLELISYIVVIWCCQEIIRFAKQASGSAVITIGEDDSVTGFVGEIHRIYTIVLLLCCLLGEKLVKVLLPPNSRQCFRLRTKYLRLFAGEGIPNPFFCIF
jgi:hypothetical protein